MSEPPADLPSPVRATPFYRFGRAIMRGVLRVMHRPRIEGLEHLPDEGGVVIASNHESFLDIPLVACSTRRHVAFVARSTLRQSRFLAYVMRQSGVILVHRDRPEHSAVRSMVEYLKRGGCVALFPEGTRTRTGALGHFRSGAVVAARKAGVPIVPAGVRGCRAVFPPERRFPKPGPVEIRFGAPIDSARPDALEELQRSIRRLRAPEPER